MQKNALVGTASSETEQTQRYEKPPFLADVAINVARSHSHGEECVN